MLPSFILAIRPWLLAGSLSITAGSATAATPVVVLLGDSITAGYGLAQDSALPARLQAALTALGQPARVIGAGVSGDTTADGLARVDFSVPDGADLCIVELGGNDLLQGQEPDGVRRRLERILARLKARHIRALVLGIKAPTQVGAAYAAAFTAAFAQAAQTGGAAYLADLLGPAQSAGLMQADGIHPTAQGVLRITARLAPAVKAALRGTR